MNKPDHHVICDSSECECEYNTGKGCCVLIEIEIKDGTCKSCETERRWQINSKSR